MFKLFIKCFVRDSTFSYVLCFKINQCVKHHPSVTLHEFLSQVYQIKQIFEKSSNLKNQVIVLTLFERTPHRVGFSQRSCWWALTLFIQEYQDEKRSHGPAVPLVPSPEQVRGEVPVVHCRSWKGSGTISPMLRSSPQSFIQGPVSKGRDHSCSYFGLGDLSMLFFIL